MKTFKKLTALFSFLGAINITHSALAAETPAAEQPDYSETQWRTFYGEKPVDYRPEFWVTYYGSEEQEACYVPDTVSLANGSPIRKKIYKQFIAEETDNHQNYTIRYPNKFKLNGCVYSSGGGQFYMEEKSDDPRLNQEPYISKTSIRRFALIRGARVMVISLIGDHRLEDFSRGKTYVNKSDYNIFCYKRDTDLSLSRNEKPMPSKFINCFSSSIENGAKKLFAYNSYISYTIDFWKQHPDINLNLRLSNKTYCDKDDFCEKHNLPKLDDKFFNHQNSEELYQKGDN